MNPLLPPILVALHGRRRAPYRIGECFLDETRGELRHGAQTQTLGRQASALLHLLAEREGRLATYGEIHARLWGSVRVGPNSIAQCVAKLRRALRQTAECPAIEVVYGRGVRLRPPVRPLSEEADDVRREGARILVLPLEARDAAGLEVGDRMAERLSSVLAMGLNVLDYGLGRAIQGLVWDPRELETRFGVQCVIAGAVEPSAAGLRVRLRLVDTATRRWSGQVEATGTDLDDLAFVLAARTAARFTEGLGRLELRSATPNEFERMLMSHARIWTLSRPEMLRARLELDELARGDVVPRDLHMHRALSYMYDYWLPATCMQDGALAAIERCIESDGPNATNVSVFGNVRSLRAEHDAAQAAVEAYTVRQAEGHMIAFLQSYALLGMGRIEDSIRRAEESLALVPHHPWSFHVWELLARGHSLRGDWDSAIRFAQRSRMLKPAFPEAHLDLAISYALAGRRELGQRALVDLRSHLGVEALCAARPARGQAWEGWPRDGLALLGLG